MEKIGYRYLVKFRITTRHWYPGQGGTEKKTSPFTSEGEFDMVCDKRGLPACHEMIEALLVQDHGEQGVHEGCGNSWAYVVDSVEYKGEVRL